MPSKYRGGGNVDVADGNYHPDQRSMSGLTLLTGLTQKDKDNIPDRGCSKVKKAVSVCQAFFSPPLQHPPRPLVRRNGVTVCITAAVIPPPAPSSDTMAEQLAGEQLECSVAQRWPEQRNIDRTIVPPQWRNPCLS